MEQTLSIDDHPHNINMFSNSLGLCNFRQEGGI